MEGVVFSGISTGQPPRSASRRRTTVSYPHAQPLFQSLPMPFQEHGKRGVEAAKNLLGRDGIGTESGTSEMCPRISVMRTDVLSYDGLNRDGGQGHTGGYRSLGFPEGAYEEAL